MARGLAPDLTKALDLLDRHILVAGQVEQTVQQHRAMAVGKNEAVAVDPMGVRGVELHELLEEDGGDIRHSHRRAGVAAIGVLDSVHGEGANAVRHFAQMRVARGRNGFRRYCRGIGHVFGSFRIVS